jgi:hypothetical protein
MTSARLLAAAFTLSLAASSCSVFHRKHADATPPVVVETVRTPDSPTPPTAARDLADAMTTVLRLRPDQTTKVRQVLSTTVEQVNAARQQYPAQSPQLNTALARINAASDKQMRTILGPTSYREMQVKRAQIQTEMQKR